MRFKTLPELHDPEMSSDSRAQVNVLHEADSAVGTMPRIDLNNSP